MPIQVTMPRMSDTMEQGTVVKWHVKEGDAVSPGDVLADIETDKATMELEAFDEGKVAKLAAAEGANILVGDLIVVLAEEGEDLAEAAKSAGSAPAAKQAGGTTDAPTSPAATATMTPDAAPSSTTERIMASPLAKKMAAEKGISLAGVTGTGPSGRVTKRDIEQLGSAGTSFQPVTQATAHTASAPSAPTPQPMPVSTQLESRNVPLSNMRGIIAKRLIESKTTIPHYQVTMSARLDALMELRGQLNSQLESQGVKLSVNDFLVRACGLAMHQHPFINSSWNAGSPGGGPSIDLHKDVNIGVAVSLPQERGGGLVVATIRDADAQGLRYISAETKRLARKAREKGLTPEEMSDSTFTISNLGMFGVEHFTAIINPPNAAILAVGNAVQKPFFETNDDGDLELVVGHEMSMTMSSDHRIIDGAMAAEYLKTVKNLLESPASLLV